MTDVISTEVKNLASRPALEPEDFGAPPAPPPPVDANGLAAELRDRIRGEVRFDAGSRALYATDASNYRQVPIGVVIPKDVDDVVETVAAARRYGAPILARGGGTSLAGQCCNVAVVMDMSKYMHRVLEVDPSRRRARVQPGTILDDLRKPAESEHGLTFGPDPATHRWCTLGGMIGNNSCGIHSVMAGKTVDNVEELEILTYDGLRMRVGQTSDEELERIINEGGRWGEIYARLKSLRDRYADLIREHYPDIPRRISGYNLDQLLPENGFHVARALVGTECTCVTFLEATVRLVPSPAARALLVLGYPSVYAAGDHVMEILDPGPIGLEGMDDRLVEYMERKGLHKDKLKFMPEGGGWLLVEFGGEDRQEADDRARELMERLKRADHPPTMKLFDDPEQTETIWKIRESGLGATANVPGMADTWPGWEDAAVPPERLGDYLRDLRRLLNRYDYDCSLYGHFGEGCVHMRIDFDLRTRDGLDTYRAFVNDAADLVVEYGGSLSGEHGDGQARGELLPKMFDQELMEAFREFKSIWDPDWKMNPGKVVDTYPIDQDLALGTNYNPPQPPTHFKFPDDNGSFARATLRCVGVGECRKMDGGTMCPSFMVLREEEHTTRGRTKLLFEMLQGDPIRDGWREESVKEALHLCLACKGCKGECPVQVDIATYKAEFLSHYYEGRPRPITAYTMGRIYWWSRLAAMLPRLANLATQTPGLRGIVKRLGGIAPQRRLPQFAGETFKQWFNRRKPRNENKPTVILWADTFNNHFHPETAQAAVEVLEAAGFQVMVPIQGVADQTLCCGRPLYEYGMLDLAKRLLREIIDTLRPQIRAGIPVVGLEPSCVAVFRDELINLYPHDEDARRLAQQTFTLGEFLTKKAVDYQLPRLHRKALVHGHCHHEAIMGLGAEEEVLSELGLDFEVLDSGCCGMAGAFGFERDKYDVSIKCGERVLLPAVRSASPDTLIIADGFSCREQIAQTTERRALHLAQAIHLAMREGREGPQDGKPERAYITEDGRTPWMSTAVAGAGIVAAGALLWRIIQERNE